MTPVQPFMQSLLRGGSVSPETGALRGNLNVPANPGFGGLSRFNYQGPNMQQILQGLNGGTGSYSPINVPKPAMPAAMPTAPSAPAPRAPASSGVRWSPGMGGYFSGELKVPEGQDPFTAYLNFQRDRSFGGSR